MQKQITFRQYRTMDLFFFSLILVISEVLITLGATVWFPGEPYTVSLSCAVAAIVMVRWGWWAAVPMAAGSIAFCLVSHAAPVQWIIYAAGSMLGLMMVPVLKKKGWESLHGNVLWLLGYGLCTALLMQLGRAGIAAVFGLPAAAILGFITTDVLSAVFTLFVVWIIRRIEGLFEDQKHYLLRIQSEAKS